MPKTKPQLEKVTVKDCLHYLSFSTKGIFWRNNTGAIPTPRGGFIRFGEDGSGDIMGILGPNGRHIEIECKRVGGKQTENQVARQKEVERMGGVYLLVYGVQDLIDHQL